MSLLKELTDLIVIYNIDEETESEIVAATYENMRWIATYSYDIQGFLDDFFNGSPRATRFSCFVILFGLAFNWIMQN